MSSAPAILDYQSLLDARPPLPGGTLHFFHEGTDVPCRLFRDRNLTESRANPLRADGAGRFAPVHLVEGAYRLELRDARRALVYALDNIRIRAGAGVPARFGFDDVAALLADTDLGHDGQGARHRVWPGDLLAVAGGALTYRVAEADDPDPHVATAGGVGLRVLPRPGGVWPAEAFGCDGGGDDVSAAMMRLFAAVPDGQVIDLGGRIHLCTSLALVSRSGLRITNGCLKKSTGDTDLLSLDDCHGLVIEADLDGNGQVGTRTAGPAHGLARNLVAFTAGVGPSGDITFRDLTMRDSQNRAVACEAPGATTPGDLVDGLSFRNVTFRNCHNMALSVTAARNVMLDRDCRYRDIRNSIADFGGLTEHVRVEGHARGCIQSAFTFHGSHVVCDVTVEDTVADPDYAGEFLVQLSNDTGTARDAVIRGRYLGQPDSPLSYGCIRVRGYDDVLIDAPLCRDVSGADTTGVAINVGPEPDGPAPRNVTIRNPRIEGFRQQGIVINDCETFALSGGLVRDTNLAGASWYGVDVVASSGTVGGGLTLEAGAAPAMRGLRWDAASTVALGTVRSASLAPLVTAPPGESRRAYHVNTGRMRPGRVLTGHLTIPAGDTQVVHDHGLGAFGSTILVTPKQDIGAGNRLWAGFPSNTTLSVSLGTALASDLDIYFETVFLAG